MAAWYLPEKESLESFAVLCDHCLTGNANCFLFSLAPIMGVYSYLPSSYNENSMYLEQNAQSLPNGLVSTVSLYCLGTFSRRWYPVAYHSMK